MTQAIVVVGKKLPNNTYGLYYSDPASGTWHQVVVGPDGSVTDTVTTTPPPVADDPNDASDTVAIKLTNTANQSQAMAAAANVLSAIQKIKLGFADDSPAKIVYSNGTKTTVGEMLSHLKNTSFTITDSPYPNNGGVGGAFYNETGGTHRIEFNFESFDGDNGDYASPAYSNMEGMVGIILHELGHVSTAGDAFWDLSNSYQRLENAENKTNISFPDGPYFANEEAWANAYSQQFAAAVGLDIDQWQPTQGFEWVDPRNIYLDNKNQGITIEQGEESSLLDTAWRLNDLREGVYW